MSYAIEYAIEVLREKRDSIAHYIERGYWKGLALKRNKARLASLEAAIKILNEAKGAE